MLLKDKVPWSVTASAFGIAKSKLSVMLRVVINAIIKVLGPVYINLSLSLEEIKKHQMPFEKNIGLIGHIFQLFSLQQTLMITSAKK